MGYNVFHFSGQLFKTFHIKFGWMNVVIYNPVQDVETVFGQNSIWKLSEI